MIRTIKNLTGKTVVIVGIDDVEEVAFFPEEDTARTVFVTHYSQKIAVVDGMVEIGVDVTVEVEGIPEKKEGVFYIVKEGVSLASPRNDLLIPVGIVIESESWIMCHSLANFRKNEGN